MRRLGSTLVVTALLLGSSVAIGTAAASTAGEPCADLTVSASPPIVPPGDPVTITGSVTNCGQEVERILVRGRVTGPCNFGFADSFGVRLEPGQTFGRDVTFPAPDCEGDYLIQGKASSEGILLDRAMETFKVCEPCQAPRAPTSPRQ
jgi:hypothetical protein